MKEKKVFGGMAGGGDLSSAYYYFNKIDMG